MKNKLRVALLFGGQSAEHEISLISARNIFNAMDKRKYGILAIAIDKQGRWFYDEQARLLRNAAITEVTVRRRDAVAVLPGVTGAPFVRARSRRSLGAVDVVFPILHGPCGEDGTVQGLLKLANLPFVGAGVVGSAAGMDKDVMKRLLRDAGIPVPKFLVLDRAGARRVDFASIRRTIGLPLFVKPANLGSSVGISKVKSQAQFVRAVREALRYDEKILLEEGIEGREIECSVLGNERPIASLPGEVITRHEFYSYDAKYIDEQGARLVIPAELPRTVGKAIQKLALEAFKVLCCAGMARVDFFLRKNREILVNEINTIPGFTQISMYPKMWAACGISYSQLIDRLIELALERFQKEKNLKTSK